MRKDLASGVIGVSLLLCVSPVEATSDGPYPTELLGWSEDGRRWAQLRPLSDPPVLEVVEWRGDRAVAVFSIALGDGPRCDAPRPGRCVSATGDIVDPLKQIDVSAHPWLRKFRLIPVKASRREAFRRRPLQLSPAGYRVFPSADRIFVPPTIPIAAVCRGALTPEPRHTSTCAAAAFPKKATSVMRPSSEGTPTPMAATFSSSSKRAESGFPG